MALAWIVVANHTHARIFEAQKRGGKIQEIFTLTHPEGRRHDRDVTTDAPGRSFPPSGQGRHAMSTQRTIKQQEALRFAKIIAEEVNRGVQEDIFDKLYIIADPEILGNLRDALHANARARVAGEITKNLTISSGKDIREHLPDLL